MFTGSPGLIVHLYYVLDTLAQLYNLSRAFFKPVLPPSGARENFIPARFFRLQNSRQMG